MALEACLSALDAQTVGDELEVVVVDDGSTAGETVAQVVARHPGARLVRRGGAGPAAARNAGARAARADMLLFTDDDCVPEVNWAEELMAAIQAGAEAVAGTTLNTGGALADASSVISWAPASVEPFAPTNNLACTKAVFEAVPFDESYQQAAAEDREWCARLAATGHALRSRPSARVHHHQRLTPTSFLLRQVRYGRGAYRFRSSARRSLEPTSFYVSLVRRGFSCGFTVGVLVTLAQIATAYGWAQGWLEMRRERKQLASS